MTIVNVDVSYRTAPAGARAACRPGGPAQRRRGPPLPPGRRARRPHPAGADPITPHTTRRYSAVPGTRVAPGHRWAEYDVLGIGYRSSGCVRYAGGANLAADPDRLNG